MVDTIKFSEMTDAGNINNNDKTPGLSDGENVLFNNAWTFLPSGTTAERPTPSSIVNYRLRFNTTDQLYEYYDAVLGVWTQLQESAFTQGPFITYTADASLPDAQNLGALANGILKQTISLGVATLNIAVNGTDYYGPGFTGYFQSPAGVKDANGNIILQFSPIASAVNYIGIGNNSTGNAPTISALGTDTNIALSLSSKGVGILNLQSAALTNQISFKTGTALVHTTLFNFPVTSFSRTVTWQDANGTVAFLSDIPILISSTNNVYYATGGNDTTGNGSLYNPYATQSKCNSVITPSAGNIWNVIAIGPAITLATFLVKPFTNYITLMPGATKITLGAVIALHSSWEGISDAPMNIIGLDFATIDTNFDFTAFTAASGQINLIDTIVGDHVVKGKGNNYPALFSGGQALSLTFTDVIGGQIVNNAVVPVINLIADNFDSSTVIDGVMEIGQLNVDSNANELELATLNTHIVAATLDASNGTLNYSYDTDSYPVTPVFTGTGGNLPTITPLTPHAAYNVPIENNLYVAESGTDNYSPTRGQILNPYATLQAANDPTSPLITNSANVGVSLLAGGYTSTELTLRPGFSWNGQGKVTSFIDDTSNVILLDPSWEGSNAKASISNVGFTNTGLTLDFSALTASSAILDFFNVDLTLAVVFTGKTAISLDVNLENVICETTLTFNGVTDADINTSQVFGNLHFGDSGAGGTTDGTVNNCQFGSVTISGSASARITNTNIDTTITLFGTSCTLQIDSPSIPNGIITYSSGATAAQVTFLTTVGINEGGNGTKGGGRPSVSVTGTTKTLALSDSGTFQNCSNGSTQTITFPPDASAPWIADAEIDFGQLGAGQLVFAAGAGVTLLSTFSNFKIATQNGGATAKHIAANTWFLTGNLTA